MLRAIGVVVLVGRCLTACSADRAPPPPAPPVAVPMPPRPADAALVDASLLDAGDIVTVDRIQLGDQYGPEPIVEAKRVVLVGSPGDLDATLARVSALFDTFVQDPHGAMLVTWQDSPIRGQRAYDPKRDHLFSVLRGWTASMSDIHDYDLAVDPAGTEAIATSPESFTTTFTSTCSGTLTNLVDRPRDLVVTCDSSYKPQAHPAKSSVHLAARATAKYKVSFTTTETTLEPSQQITEAGAPVVYFNRYATDHGRDWIDTVRKIRAATPLDGEVPNIDVTDHRGTENPLLIAPADWASLPAARRDEIAKIAWKLMAPHCKKFHSEPLSAIALRLAGTDEIHWNIENGRAVFSK